MKNRMMSFFAGAGTALALATCLTTALAAGHVSYNFVNVSMDGAPNITANNEQKVSGSILYIDKAGGKTNDLPIRTIGELLEVQIGYNSTTKTELLSKRLATSKRSEKGRLPLRNIYQTKIIKASVFQLKNQIKLKVNNM